MVDIDISNITLKRLILSDVLTTCPVNIEYTKSDEF